LRLLFFLTVVVIGIVLTGATYLADRRRVPAAA
jgi:hypothetical protein